MHFPGSSYPAMMVAFFTTHSGTMPGRKIIIDCDPGQDDAVMLLLALACPDELDLLGNHHRGR